MTMMMMMKMKPFRNNKKRKMNKIPPRQKQTTCPHLCQLNIISSWAAAGPGAVLMATATKLM